MKHNATCLLTVLLAVLLSSLSCSQEELDPQGEGGGTGPRPVENPELILTVNPEDVVLIEEKHDKTAVTFSWTTGTTSKSRDLEEMTYSFELRRKGDAKVLPYVVFEGRKDVYSLKMTAEELNDLLIRELEVRAGETVELLATVTAAACTKTTGTKTEVGTETVTKTEAGTRAGQEASAELRVKTYVPMPESMYIVGSATVNGWDADKGIAMERTKKGVFRWEGYLNAGELKFLTQLGQFLPSYNKAGENELVYRTSDDEPDEKFVISTAGSYRININLLSNYVGISEKVIDVPRYDKIYFVGNPNGWTFEPLQRDLLDPFLFRMGRYIGPGEGRDFKFGTEPGSWENMFKATVPDAPISDKNVAFITGYDPDNKWFIKDSECGKTYKICLDIRPGMEKMMMRAYSPYPKAWLVGTAVPGGAAAGNELAMKTVDDYVFEWTGHLDEGKLQIHCGDDQEHKRCWAMPGISKEPVGEVEPCLFVSDLGYFRDQYPTIDIVRVDYSWSITEAGYYKVVFNQLDETAIIVRWGDDFKHVVSDLSVELTTDKAIYAPGQTVTFKAENLPPDAMIRYRCNGETIGEHPASGPTWTWNPPYDNFKGYMVEVYRAAAPSDGAAAGRSDGWSDGAAAGRSDGWSEEVILGTIAVDVSGDWKRYPRYGFVGDFGADKLEAGVIRKEMEFLNRCHINGVQFYDWHNKHHWPLGGTRDRLDPVYKDIANRDVHTATVQKYIEIQHQYGMKCMFYNLCNGALKDGGADGVQKDWAVYKNSNGTNQDQHPLPSNWKSNIYLLDPANPGWQDYLSERNDEVYTHFDFDGFHIDQLGDRDNLYAADGHSVWLAGAYGHFINAMKKSHPNKRLVMNAVGGYGSKEIAETGNVEFMYNEVWGNQAEYRHLHEIIKENDGFSNHTRNTVFAAYMNYECSYRDFNVPGILLADAVMFSLGGAHLELGDHMLCREYFPNQDVKMSDYLKTQIVRYYDFLTAYQNLLRGKSTSAETDPAITLLSSTDAGGATSSAQIYAWPPQKRRVVSYAKNVEGRKVIHLLNFMNADQTSWRDLTGSMPEPPLLKDLQVKVRADRSVQRVWIASPDFHAGALQDLPFSEVDGYVHFTIPHLKYWDMIVME